MFPATSTASSKRSGFPHAGGDVSKTHGPPRGAPQFSPRRWGCFGRPEDPKRPFSVFPTQVGMFLDRRRSTCRICSFPHAGGDVSLPESVTPVSVGFSPRRWGCFRYCLERSWLRRVFPTQVGMFPSCLRGLVQPWRFPHAGGDVSRRTSSRLTASSFSPRRWGCFRR